jgi:hypothetical protein
VAGINAYIADAKRHPVNDDAGGVLRVADVRRTGDVHVLGLHVAGPLNRNYCGGGSRALRRAALVASLLQAAGDSFDQVYPAEGDCAAGDQMCSDSIQYRALGGITQPNQEWINRPTFQQADEILGHGPR